MPRRGNVPKREILPDPMYNSVLVTKLVNSIMLDGKKGVAQKVVYGAFDLIKEKTEKEPLEVFTQAMENIMPSLEVKADCRLYARPHRDHLHDRLSALAHERREAGILLGRGEPCDFGCRADCGQSA